MKTAAQVHRVTIIAYCLMDNHVHLLVHLNGGDIGKFMKNINNPYAKTYNKINERFGHLFADRYKNIVIKDEVHLLRTSTYIHNNAKDLLWKGYRSIEDYPYSSIKDFIKPSQGRGIADPSYILNFMSDDGSKVRNHYKILLEIQSQDHESFAKEVEEAFRIGEYKSEKQPIVRGVEPKKVLSVLANLLQQSNTEPIMCKFRRQDKVYKSLAVICLRIFCDMTFCEITEIFRGYSTSCIGYLSKEGFEIMEEMALYPVMLEELS